MYISRIIPRKYYLYLMLAVLKWNCQKENQNRLTGYDYSQNGAYFITICIKDRENLLWQKVGATAGRPYNDHIIRNESEYNMGIHRY